MIWFWLWSWTWIWTRLWRWICIWYVVRCDEVMTTNVNVTMNMIKTCNDLMWWHYVWSLGDEVPTTLVGQPQCYTRSISWLFQIVFCLETIVFERTSIRIRMWIWIWRRIRIWIWKWKRVCICIWLWYVVVRDGIMWCEPDMI